MTCLIGAAMAAPSQAFSVAGGEVFDGVSNPYPAFASLDVPSHTYTFFEEMVIPDATTIYLNDPANAYDAVGNVPTPSVTFDFSSATGGLVFGGSLGSIDVHPGTRNANPGSTFTLEMGPNNIGGGGQLINGPFVVGETGDPMSVAINSLGDIDLGAINVGRNDASTGVINVHAEGSVSIDLLKTLDTSDGGGSGGSIFVRGESVMLGDIDTHSARTNSDPNNGDISIVALAPPAFDENDANSNTAASNIITLTGLVNTDSPAPDSVAGNLSLTAVKVILESGFSATLNETGTFSIKAGEIISGYAAGDLYMDMSGSGVSASHSVAHDAGNVPEPSTVALVLMAGMACWAARRPRTTQGR